jgi:hypothetical protein
LRDHGDYLKIERVLDRKEAYRKKWLRFEIEGNGMNRRDEKQSRITSLEI